jgi:hypothetical protein
VFWPFLTWTMYKDARPPGPIVTQRRRIVGLTSTGREVEVTSTDVGLGPPALARLFIRRMLAGDSTAAQRLANRVNPSRGDPFVGLRLEGTQFTVTDAGIVREDLPVTSFRVSPSPSR